MIFELMTAEELIKRMGAYKFKQLHIHHTWKPSHKDFNGVNHAKLQEGMRAYHVNTNGWDDIGQHVTLFPDGLFGIGRNFAKDPCSIKGWNSGAFCIEMLGNFDKGQDVLQGAQLTAVLKTAKYFGVKYGYETIKFHRDNVSAGKTCPGSGVDKEEFIRAAKEYKEVDSKAEDSKEESETLRFDLFGQKIAQVQGKLIDGRAFVQARELLEAMDFKVGWEEGSKTIVIR